MKKQLAALVGLALASGTAFAAPAPGTWGLGFAHGDNSSNTLYIPYTISDDMWVEPFVSYHYEKRRSGSDEGKTKSLSVGVGLFKDVFQTSQTHAYVGGRLGYSRVRYEPKGHSGSTTDGVMAQPTIGFAYNPVDNVGLGAEAYLTWNHGHHNDDTDDLDTGAALFVRYYFGE